LRTVFEEHRLFIPGRYVALVDDLNEFSFKNGSGVYVLALAIAVDLCLNQKVHPI